MNRAGYFRDTTPEAISPAAPTSGGTKIVKWAVGLGIASVLGAGGLGIAAIVIKDKQEQQERQAITDRIKKLEDVVCHHQGPAFVKSLNRSHLAETWNFAAYPLPELPDTCVATVPHSDSQLHFLYQMKFPKGPEIIPAQ